jgi:putative acetyltransferase
LKVPLATVVIREEGPADIAGIRAVVEAAFSRPHEADLVERLRADGDRVISLVAIDDANGIVGQVMLSRMAAPFRALGLAPVAVAPDRQRAGVGSRLIRAGLGKAAAEGWEAVFVLGEPAYYRRFGFSAALASGFASPYAGPYLMALVLSGPLPATEGRIEYAPAFHGIE